MGTVLPVSAGDNLGQLTFEATPAGLDGAAAAWALTTTSTNAYDFVRFERGLRSGVVAWHDTASCTLWVDGSGGADIMTLGVNDRGEIVVNGGATLVFGPAPSVATTCWISVSGHAGRDLIAVDGALASRTDVDGGTGVDLVVHGAATARVSYAFAQDVAADADTDVHVDFDDDGDLDIFLVNAPGGDNALRVYHYLGADEVVTAAQLHGRLRGLSWGAIEVQPGGSPVTDLGDEVTAIRRDATTVEVPFDVGDSVVIDLDGDRVTMRAHHIGGVAVIDFVEHAEG